MLLSLVGLLAGAALSLKVAVLSNHKADDWTSSSCKASAEDLVECNLRVFADAITTAKAENVSLLVFPEGYALGGKAEKGDYFEPFDINGTTYVGSNPCSIMDSQSQPALFALSCGAKHSAVAVAANIFTVNTETQQKHITEMVFDDQGNLLSAYNKHHLFPTEVRAITPGPFKPTYVDLLGHRWGLVICYEGVYPSLTGDWSQFDALVHEQNSTAIIWSVGGTEGLLKSYAEKIANRYKVPVLATEDYDGLTASAGSAYIIGADGKQLAGSADAAIGGLKPLGYGASPYIRFASM